MASERFSPLYPVQFQPYGQWVNAKHSVQNFYLQPYLIKNGQYAGFAQRLIRMPEKMVTELDPKQNVLVACLEDPDDPQVEGASDYNDEYDLLVGVLSWDPRPELDRLSIELEFCLGTYKLDKPDCIMGRIAIHNDLDQREPGQWILDVEDEDGDLCPEKQVRGSVEHVIFGLSLLVNQESKMPSGDYARQFILRVHSLLDYATEHDRAAYEVLSLAPPPLVRQ